ncbi:MAG: hypothetical protein JJ902_01310 [Roseibium sp.]|nr:hypothetical protein [Roseibium sp.]
MTTVLGIEQPIWTIGGLFIDIIGCFVVAINWRRIAARIAHEWIVRRLREDLGDVQKLDREWIAPIDRPHRTKAAGAFLRSIGTAILSIPFPGVKIWLIYWAATEYGTRNKRVIRRIARDLNAADIDGAIRAQFNEAVLTTRYSLELTNPYMPLRPIIENAIRATKANWNERKNSIIWNPLWQYLSILVVGFACQIVGAFPL